MPEERKGPYLIMVCFCENALQEKDDVFSAIRLVDTLTVKAEGSEVPDLLPKLLIQPWLLVRFASQGIAGKFPLQIIGTAPSGKQQKLFQEQPILIFEKEKIGANVRIKLALGMEEIGTHWFAIHLDGKFLGEAPIRINYQPTPSSDVKK